MNVRPLYDRLIVHRLEEGEQEIGGIIIPDTAKEKPKRVSTSKPEIGSCSAGILDRKSSSRVLSTSS